ncbi:MAG: acyl carrier protein [Acidobacteria bacterium]|nr:acyl carrier protein [Acidobacteriota bacterium]MBI3656382.1 acyl carrier protein [Acidobacteriota bacterium]
MTVEERVIKVIANAIHVEAAKIKADATFEELGIDSLDGVYIVFGLEEEFNITIPESMAQQIKSVREAVNKLSEVVTAAP